MRSSLARRLSYRPHHGYAPSKINWSREVFKMSESAETVVRKYLAAWKRSDLDELVSFISDDAVFTDGPRGVHHGIDAIRAELGTMVKVVPSTSVDIKKLVARGGTVMVERVDNFK